MEARIIAVADAYDVMTSYRSYSTAMAPKGALEEIEGNARAQFDPDCARALGAVVGHPSS